MENNISREKLEAYVNTLQRFLDHRHNKNEEPYIPMHNNSEVNEAINAAIGYFQREINDDVQKSENKRFYAPVWTRKLLMRLSEKNVQFNEVERKIYVDMVGKLSVNDYKPATDDLMGYELVYTSPQEIVEIVTALKSYFDLL